MTLSVQTSYANNWKASINAGMLQQDYHEIDTGSLTEDGVLNRETGAIPIVNIAIENNLKEKNTPESWIPYIKVSASYASGDTGYDGYLQSGTVLTPYKTDTKNKLWDASVTIGAEKQLNQRLSVKPNIRVGHYRWQRELEQYTEEFKHTAILAGVDMGLHLQDWLSSSRPVKLKTSASYGRLIDARIDVAKFGLKQSIGKQAIWQVRVQGDYSLSMRTDVTAGMTYKSWQYAQSNEQNGFKYPESESKHLISAIGLTHKF